MKKKKIELFVFLLIGVLSLILTYKFKQNSLSKNKPIKEEKLSIMIKEDGATDYTKSSSKEIPKGDYVLNKEKTHCENNGEVISYDNVNGVVGFSFIGSDKCYLYFDYYISPSAWETILINNSAGANDIDSAIGYFDGKDAPDFTQVSTTNEGMYATQDDYGTSYYFRGAVDNNWIKFGKYSSDGPIRGYADESISSKYKEYNTLEECNSASDYNYNCSYAWNTGDDMYWRIIRINGDGSIRLIYTGTTAPTESEKVVMTGVGTYIGLSAFNNNCNSSEYIGYKYEIGVQHGLENDSTIKTTLENWYELTTLYTDNKISDLVADTPFCYDRTAASNERGDYGEIDEWASTGTTYFYGSYGRLIDKKIPSLKCPNDLDSYSVFNETLTYPVGLITTDEVNLAGVNIFYSNNISFYLSNGLYYWTGSPRQSLNTSMVYPCAYSSFAPAYVACNSYGVRPVISLSSEARLSGDGSWNNPYVVES